MPYFLRLMVCACCALACFPLGTGPAEARRVALVIGNAQYRIGPLANPLNDAAAVAEAFERQLKFDKVMLRRNLAADGFRAALREMAQEAAGADFGVVYFAGHGIEVGGRNFLVPTDATLAAARDVDLEAIALDTVLGQLDGVRKLKLVILDACRNNPFSVAGGKRSVSRGLGRIEPEGNTLVAYAAKDGTTADDGKGRHSPFTGALLKRVATPGLDVRRLFGYVSDDVLAATNRVQEPYLYGRLGGAEIFLLPSQPPPAGVAVPVAPAAPARNEGAEAWAAVKDSTSIAQLEVIATRYRGTVYADLAQARIDELRRQEEERRKLALAVPPKAPAPQPPPMPGPPSGWTPQRPVDFVVPAGTGGGLDQMARFIQGVVAKHNAMRQPVIVMNKGAGAGAEGFLELKRSAGNPHMVLIAGSNLFTTPYATGVPFGWKDLTPVAMLALDEFALWVPADAPYRTASAYLDAVRAGDSGTFKMGGTGVKQEDQILTAALERFTAPKRFTYIPYRGGGAVAVQLVGKHINSSVNNPIEAVSQWNAGAVRPLCIFSPRRSAHAAWSSIPTCRDAGVSVEYQMLRGVFLPPGVRPEHVAFYVDLFRRVMATDDWRTFVAQAAFDQTFMTGGQFRTWLEANDRLHYDLMRGAGFLAPGK